MDVYGQQLVVDSGMICSNTTAVSTLHRAASLFGCCAEGILPLHPADTRHIAAVPLTLAPLLCSHVGSIGLTKLVQVAMNHRWVT